MARDPQPRVNPAPGWHLGDTSPEAECTIFRSGGWYLVRRGPLGRAIRPDGHAGPALPFGSLLAHVAVAEPWRPAEQGDDIPPAILALAHSPAGWEVPAWAT